MTSYYRVCNGVKDKGIFVSEGTDFSKYTSGEFYVSVFKYNEEQKQKFEQTGTVAGIQDVTGDILYFDLDSSDLEQARKDTITLVNRLEKYFPSETINIALSGNKGFHVSVHTQSSFKSEEAKSFAVNLCSDLASFDSRIYNANRLIRVEGSVHPKTKLRKTRINKQELINEPISYMQELSKDLYSYIKPVKAKLSNEVIELMSTVEVKKDEVTITDSVDYFANPLQLQPWKLAISQGFFPSGTRSDSLMILASTLKNRGMNETQCYYYLKAAADLQATRYQQDKFSKDEIWKNIITQVYNPNWKNGCYSEENFPAKLKTYFEELGIPRKEFKDVAGEVIKIDEQFDDFASYAMDIDKYTMRFGIPSLDKRLKVRKGHLIGMLAGPGVGKTSFAIELLNNTSNEGINSVFASYDMYKHNVYQKLIQRHTKYTEDELFNFFKNRDMQKISEFKQILTDNYKNVAFCFKSGQSITELKKTIKMQEESTGKSVELVVVDYLELIQTDKSDPTASSAEAINGLREIANEGRVVVTLLQPNKMSSKPDEPMLSYNAAKGSSMIAQAVTAMFTCNRPGYSSETPENDKFFSINCVKNRNGPLFSLDFAWDGKTQRISEMDSEQRAWLKMLRESKMEQDEEDDI
jgi:KaiC/GvpD/RAD55 family RecA-like ATPase